MKDHWCRHTLLLLVIVGPLPLAGCSLLDAQPAMVFASDTCLESQAAALGASAGVDLDNFANAPRYTITAELDPASHSVEGDLSVDYVNQSDEALSELVFRLLPNARTIYGGGSITVKSVQQGRHTVVFDVSDDQTVLHAPLPMPLRPGANTRLDLSFALQVPVDTELGYGILNQAQGVTALGGWYPILAAYDDGWQAPPIPAVGDASWAETSLYDVALTAPDGMEVVSTGTVVDRRRIGDSMRWHILTGPVREFAAAISADFERHGADVGDARLNYYILPHPNSATPPDVALSLAGKALDVYEDRFGPYPYADSTWRS